MDKIKLMIFCLMSYLILINYLAGKKKPKIKSKPIKSSSLSENTLD
jgi:hypothetical protein